MVQAASQPKQVNNIREIKYTRVANIYRPKLSRSVRENIGPIPPTHAYSLAQISPRIGNLDWCSRPMYNGLMQGQEFVYGGRLIMKLPSPDLKSLDLTSGDSIFLPYPILWNRGGHIEWKEKILAKYIAQYHEHQSPTVAPLALLRKETRLSAG